MIVVRLRTRDGLERINVPDDATVGSLREAISEQIKRPAQQFVISMDQSLLTSKTPETFLDLADDDDSLKQLGFSDGQMVFCFYEGTRDVNPGYNKSLLSTRPFGVHLDVAGIMAKQVRIERQDAAHVTAVSFDRYSAHSFQQYVQSAHAFSIKRCGLLYGRLGEDKVVYVDAVYEPEQSGQSETISYNLDNAQTERADAIARTLGLQRVGIIFNQSTSEKDYILNDQEIQQICEIQDLVGEHCVAAVFSLLDEDGHREVHLEAFQCSDQAVKLWSEGWFQDVGDKVSGLSRMKNPKEPDIQAPVMISGKDTDEVDNDFFLVPLAVKDHEGSLLSSFPVENRLTGQTTTDLKQHLQKHSSITYSDRLADFHLLLWLAENSGLGVDTDIPLIVEAVHTKTPIMEGYKVMIDSVAGL
eukprot:jgi/Ulvmu1/8924/UM005_0015.1